MIKTNIQIQKPFDMSFRYTQIRIIQCLHLIVDLASYQLFNINTHTTGLIGRNYLIMIIIVKVGGLIWLIKLGQLGLKRRDLLVEQWGTIPTFIGKLLFVLLIIQIAIIFSRNWDLLLEGCLIQYLPLSIFNLWLILQIILQLGLIAYWIRVLKIRRFEEIKYFTRSTSPTIGFIFNFRWRNRPNCEGRGRGIKQEKRLGLLGVCFCLRFIGNMTFCRNRTDQSRSFILILYGPFTLYPLENMRRAQSWLKGCSWHAKRTVQTLKITMHQILK